MVAREMSGADPLVSVIIPTRSRARTLEVTLATALDQRSQDYEVIVSNNLSEDDTREVVGGVKDARLRYFETGQRLSMCDNYEFALTQARGTYVIIIGDDDAVIPGALDDLIAILKAVPEPTIHMWPLHIYDWPALGRPGRVDYLAPAFEPFEIDLKAKARWAYRMGGWKYYELPSPYHAAVPKQFLDAIRKRTGRVFHSTQPDVFTAMALPAFADRAVNLGKTVTFNGRSGKSNGLGFVSQDALPNIHRFLAEYGEDYAFHPSLPTNAAAAALMIPDAVLKAADLFPELYNGKTFGQAAMWAYICRLGFASHAAVLTGATGDGLSMKGSLHFLGLSMVHEGAALRRRILNRAADPGVGDAKLATVKDFADLLGARDRATSALRSTTEVP